MASPTKRYVVPPRIAQESRRVRAARSARHPVKVQVTGSSPVRGAASALLELRSARHPLMVETAGSHFVMDVEHRPDVEKVQYTARMVNSFASRRAVRAEIARCDIVCANCHRIRTQQRRKAAPPLSASAPRSLTARALDYGSRCTLESCRGDQPRVAQRGRAPASEAGGRWFESSRADQPQVAQGSEHGPDTPGVGGSSPPLRTVVVVAQQAEHRAVAPGARVRAPPITPGG